MMEGFARTRKAPFSKAPPLGECPKDKGGAASGEEAVADNLLAVTEG